MFYVSSKLGNKFGVTDTRDGIEEFYSIDVLTTLYLKNIQIIGVSGINQRTGNPIVCVIPKEFAKLFYVETGTPVVVRTSSALPPKQCLVVSVDVSGVTLFDSTLFKFSYDFLTRGNILIDFEHNDECAVANLLRQVGVC